MVKVITHTYIICTTYCEQSGHLGVEMLSPEIIGGIQRENIIVLTLFSCLLFLSQSCRELVNLGFG